MDDSILKQAKQLNILLRASADQLPDDVVVDVPDFLSAWSGDGVKYEVGKRLTYHDTVYKVLQAHTSQPDWTPETAVSLFAKVLTDEVSGKPLVWVKPESTNPYKIGDRVLYPDENGDVYESVIDGNVWSPDEYAAGWKRVTE